MIEEAVVEPVINVFVANNMEVLITIGIALLSELVGMLPVKSNSIVQLIINVIKGTLKGKTMKMFLVVFTAIMLFCIPASAAEFNPNIAADVVYTVEGESMQGIGTDLATWQDGLIQLRLAYVTALQDDSASDYTGIGVGINLVKVIEKAGGNWVAVKMNPSLGIMGLADLNGDASPTVAAYINVIRIDF